VKRLLSLFLFVPFFASAQEPEGMELWRQRDCYQYVLGHFTEKTGVIKDIARRLLPPNVKTIYVLKESYLEGLPDTMNGYAIRYINQDSCSLLHNEPAEQSPPVLYFSSISNQGDFYYFWLIPAHIIKGKLEFEEKGCSFKFELTRDNRFEHRFTDCN
jgi:hypothetical protein